MNIELAYGYFKKLLKSVGGYKYIRKDWNNGRWRYWYFNPITKKVEPSNSPNPPTKGVIDIPYQKLGFIDKLKNFFGGNKEQAVQAYRSDYENIGKGKSEGYFQTQFNLYFLNKEKVDEYFKKLAEKKVSPPTKKKEISGRGSQINPSEKSKSNVPKVPGTDLDFNIAKKLYQKYNAVKGEIKNDTNDTGDNRIESSSTSKVDVRGIASGETRPIGSGINTSGGVLSSSYDTQRYAKDGIAIARSEFTVFPKADHIPENLRGTLRDHQKDFINLAVEKFQEGNKGILNMDGTGAGKTREQIGLAATYLTKNPTAKILITTAGDNIVNDAFLKDAQAMGVGIFYVEDQGQIKEPGIYITTYSKHTKIKSDFRNIDLAIFDESHKMKNYGTATQENGSLLMKSAKNIASFSATPVDKALHMGHVCEALGMNHYKTMNALGYTLEEKSIGYGRTVKEYRTRLKPADVASRLSSLFNDLSGKGLAIKREVPLSNLDLSIQNVEFSPEFQEKYNKEFDAYQKEILANPKSKGTALMSLNRFVERGKVDHAVSEIEKGLKEGKQIVLFAGSVNDSEFKGQEELTEGTLKQISAQLEAKGLLHSKVFGGSSTKKGKAQIQSDIAKFMSGEHKIIIATPQSGGTGISLDDTVGDKPRKMIIMTPPFSAVEFMQNIGRINRLTTKSKAEAILLKSPAITDEWTTNIIANKITTLGGAAKGDYAKIDIEDLDKMQYMNEEERKEYYKNKPSLEKAITPDNKAASINIDNLGVKKQVEEVAIENKPTPPSSISNLSHYSDVVKKFGFVDIQLQFGKYKGKKLSDVRKNDSGYFRWMMETAGVKIQDFVNKSVLALMWAYKKLTSKKY